MQSYLRYWNRILDAKILATYVDLRVPSSKKTSRRYPWIYKRQLTVLDIQDIEARYA